MPGTTYTFEYLEVPENADHPAHPGLRWANATQNKIRRRNSVYVNNCPQTGELFQLYFRAYNSEYMIPLFLGSRDGYWVDSLPLSALPAGTYWVGLWRPGVAFTKEPQDQDLSTQTPKRFFEAHAPGNGNGHHSVVVLIEE